MNLRNLPQLCMLGFMSGFCIRTSARIVHESLAGSVVLGLLGLIAMILSVDVALGFPMISRISRRRDAQLRSIREAYAAELDRDAAEDR